MARVRTGYTRVDDGTGQVRMVRDPGRDRDIGPAAAGVVDGVAAIGRLSAMRVRSDIVPDAQAHAAGYGEIERRKATPEDLARLTPVETPKPVAREGRVFVPARPLVESQQASRQRGADRNRELHAQRAASRGAQAAPPPASLEAPIAIPVTAVQEEEPMAVTTAAPPALDQVRVDAPCATCLHKPVCAIQHYLSPGAFRVTHAAVAPEPALQLRVVVTAECEHYLGKVQPEPIRREHGGESWRTKPEPSPVRVVREASIDEVAAARVKRHASSSGEAQEKTARAQRVLEAVERHGGDRAAAAQELGMKLNAIAMVLKFADRRVAPAAEGATA